MKRRNAEITIFGMATLDLFASALGAFILVTLILFPYFPNTADQEQLEQTQQDLQRAQAKLTEQIHQNQENRQSLVQCEKDKIRLQQPPPPAPGRNKALEQCLDQLKKKFVLVLMSWGTKDDVDLHVVDPEGREFYYKKKSFPGTPAKLEEDNIHGPGNEIWLHPVAGPGKYRIYYNYYKRRTPRVAVRGAVLTPQGRTPLPRRTLQWEDQKPLVAVVQVDEEGHIDITPADLSP